MRATRLYGLRLDSALASIGHKIITAVSDDAQSVRNMPITGVHVNQEVVDTCLKCTKPACSGSCRKVMDAERENTNPNMRRANNNRRYEYKGRMYSSTELAELSGISVWTIRDRLGNGWSVAQAVETPTNGRRKRNGTS